MTKTYRQPHCREDWQDISKLRFKDDEGKIVAVFIDEKPELVKCAVTLIKKIEDIGKYVAIYYDFNGLHENERFNILIETEQPEPDAKTIMNIMLSDFAVSYPDEYKRWTKIALISPSEKSFWIHVAYRFDFVKIKEFLFSRDGETILTYDQVIEELNNE